jgi:hypothetical protein
MDPVGFYFTGSSATAADFDQRVYWQRSHADDGASRRLLLNSNSRIANYFVSQNSALWNNAGSKIFSIPAQENVDEANCPACGNCSGVNRLPERGILCR